MKDLEAQEFSKTAREAYKAFPDKLRGLVVFLLPASDKPVFVAPDIKAHLTVHAADVQHLTAQALDHMRKQKTPGTVWTDDVAGTKVNIIALSSEITLFGFEHTTKEMCSLLILDHEIGHRILKQHGESAADAFSLLRHIQRFGMDTDLPAVLADKRALSLILSQGTDWDLAHYTSDTLERVFQVTQQQDISKLSLRETANLADKITQASQPSAQTVKAIHAAFYCVAKVNHEKSSPALTLRKTIAVMRKDAFDPNITRAGKLCLNFPQNKQFMQELATAEKGNYWKNALKFIDDKADKKPAAPMPRLT